MCISIKRNIFTVLLILSSIITLSSVSNANKIVLNNQLNHTIYEDAEDANIDGWSIYDNSPIGAKISNVYDNDKESNVIQFSGKATDNGYKIGGEWNNIQAKTITWSMKYTEYFRIFILVNTNDGLRYMTYIPRDKDTSWGAKYPVFGLGSNVVDGQWHVFTRDLQADLTKAEPGNILLSVDAFLIRGSGFIDDIKLISSEEILDTLAPVITLAGNTTQTVIQNTIYNDAGASALDDKDGTVTVITTGNVDTSTIGIYTLTYTAKDTAGNTATKTRTVKVISNNHTIYEDAEEGNIDGWSIYDNSPIGAKISNVYDNDKESNVIQFSGSATSNGYRLGKAWNNTTATKIKWSMKYSEKFTIYISLETQNGHRYLYYTPYNIDRGLRGKYIHLALGSESNNGTWQNFTRDLEADLKKHEPDNKLLAVDAFLIRGSGLVDDIELISGGETPDSTPPIITVTGNNPETVIQNTIYNDAGASALDDRNGTVTVTTTGNVDTSSVGIYTLTYTAKDTAGNTATKTRTVTVVLPADTTAPVITIIGNTTQTVIQNSSYTDAGATATDDRDATVTVSTSGNVNAAALGTYSIIYTAKDAAGNTATKTRTVTVVLADEPTPVCESGPAMQQGQVTDSISTIELADVLVSIAGCSTKTDANGYYTLNNIVENDNAVVNFEKEGYLLGSSKIQIKSLSEDATPSPNYLEVGLNAYASWNPWSFDSQVGATGGAVEAPASIYTDAIGNIYNGTIYSNWIFVDTMTTKRRDTFPGTFEGINSNGITVAFVSYGFMSLSLEDENTNPLSITDHITLVLDSVTGTTQEILSLWYYDYKQGVWIEDGYAQRQTNGTYHADISHPGTWSINQVIEEEPGIYRSRIVYEDGNPAQNIRVSALGTNWINTDLSTDADGMFEIKVVPRSSFQLTAYNYKDKYNAIYSELIPAIDSGVIVE